jgi:hypothetical protein
MNSDKPILLILGSGIVSSQVLDFVARTDDFSQIVIASRSKEKVEARANLARLIAGNLGCFPRITVQQVDLQNLDQTAALIQAVRPNIIFQAATLWPWWRIRELPTQNFTKLDSAGVGPWLPLFLALTFCVMKALKASGHKAHVVNACFPDAVNACLNNIGLTPTIGIGNIANSIPLLKLCISDGLRINPDDVQIALHGHHWAGFRVPAVPNALDLPILLQVRLPDGTVLRDEEVRPHLQGMGLRYPRVRGLAGQGVTVTSAVNVLRALASHSPVRVHAPGPNGLEGGYPCIVSKEGVNIEPTVYTLEQAQAVNCVGQRLDGISAIESGVVRFTPENIAILRETIGCDWESFPIVDTLSFASELLSRYESYSHHLPKQPIQ